MYVSAKGLDYTVKEYKQRYPENNFLKNIRVKNVDGKLLDDAFDVGEKSVIEIYKYTGYMLGLGLAQIASFTNFLETEILDHVFAGAAYTAPGTKYLALFTAISDGEAGIIGASYLNRLKD